MERIVWKGIPGGAHHVTQRGKNDPNVFFVAGGKHVSPGLLRKPRQRFGRRIERYRPTANRIGLVTLPDTGDALESYLATVKTAVADVAACATLRRAQRTGRPLGGDSYLNKLKTHLSQRVRPLSTGWALIEREAKPEIRRTENCHEHGKKGKNERKVANKWWLSPFILCLSLNL